MKWDPPIEIVMVYSSRNSNPAISNFEGQARNTPRIKSQLPGNLGLGKEYSRNSDPAARDLGVRPGILQEFKPNY